jgi:hypothetical protein
LKHRVKFTIKNVDESDPNFKLIDERSKKFKTFSGAMSFVRELKVRLSGKEILIGTPMIEESK